MRRFLVMLVLPILALVAVEASAETVRIMANVEVRSYSSPEAPVVGALAKGTVIEVVAREGSWVRIRIPESGYPGYVPAVFCEGVEGVAPYTPPRAPAPAAAPVAPTYQPPAAPVAPVAPPPQTYAPPAPSPAPAVTQAPQFTETRHQRKGFWIGLGGGYGSAAVSVDCDDCSGDREGSFTGFIKLGGTLNPQLLLGVESNAWVKSEDIGYGIETTTVLGAVSGTVTLYPVVNSGFFLKGGVGLSYVSSETYVSGVTVGLDKTGWGLIGGLGYDLRVGGNISITPSFNYYYGKPGDISVEGIEIPGWSQNVLDFSLGVTFH